METSVNNKCRAFTSLEQSRKLAEILPPESADMKWYFWKSEIDAPKLPTFGYNRYAAENYRSTEAVYLPCWSLAALLDILPYNLKLVLAINDFQGEQKERYVIGSVEHDKYDCYADNPIDACVAMINKLHERKML